MRNAWVFSRLVGDGRYDPKDHTVTIVADSCPYSSQVISHTLIEAAH